MILKKIIIENFKGIHYLEIDFQKNLVIISGRNATGKTTILDAWFWLLFGKNSQGDSKFEIRELDRAGNKVHQTEISVTAIVDLDGEEKTITRKQTENWVKKRGQQDRELSGNKDSFEINGFPKSKTEYEQFISSIIDEKVFRILSNPMTFPAMDWKEQRKLLLSLIDIKPDVIGAVIPDFNLIAGDLTQESPDAVKKKYAKEKTELEKQQKQLPIEINTLYQQITDIHEDELKSKESSLNDSISEVQAKIFELSKVSNSATEAEIQACKVRQSTIVASANDERNATIRSARNAFDNIEREEQSLTFRIGTTEARLKRMQNDLANKKAQIDSDLDTYQKLKDSTFPEDKKVCPTCGQSLPADSIAKLKADWEENKKQQLDEKKASGNALAKNIKALARDVSEEEKRLDDEKKKLTDLGKKKTECKQALDAAVNAPVIVGNELPGYKELEKKITELTASLIDTEEAKRQTDDLRNQEQDLKEQLSNVISELAQVKVNERLNNQIEQRRDELKDVAQKIADCERMLFALENYVKAIAEEINKHFAGLTFKLFDNLINGAIVETCQITFDGVPYGSLNSGHRIIVGLHIIETFQKLYGIKVPVWIDNSESVSHGNMPEMDCQMICLEVSDGDKLTVS